MKALAAVPRVIASRQYNHGVQLVDAAAGLFPDSSHNRAAWVEAVQYLRRRGIWVLDKKIGKSAVTRY